MVSSTCPAQWLLQRPWYTEQLPQTPLFGKQDSEAPLSSSTGKKWVCSRGGDSNPKASSSFSEHKADMFNSTLLQKAQSGPFLFLPQRCFSDKSRQKPCARKISWQGASSCHPCPAPAWSGFLSDQDMHADTCWHSQGPRSPEAPHLSRQSRGEEPAGPRGPPQEGAVSLKWV